MCKANVHYCCFDMGMTYYVVLPTEKSRVASGERGGLPSLPSAVMIAIFIGGSQ